MDLDSRHQQQVTGGDCNSVQPSWAPDSEHIVYGSDCGRGVGETALCTRDVVR
jgi:Tol biopolymer transport system component